MSDPQPAEVLSRRLRVTLRGWAFLGVAVLLGLAAAASANNLLFLLVSMLGGIFAASLVFTLLGPRGLEIGRSVPDAVHAHEAFGITLRVRNPRRLLPAFDLRLDDRLTHGGVPAAVPRAPARVPFARPGETIGAETSAAPFRRGPADFGPLTITSEFPPGLVTYEVDVAVKDQILVYPRQGVIERRILNPYLSRLAEPDLFPTANRQGDDEFAGLRDFRPGDNPRRIHWKSLARQPSRLVVKEYEDARVREAVIFLDTFVPDPRDAARVAHLRGTEGPHAREARLERAVSFAAALAEALVAKNYVVRVRAFAPGPLDVTVDARRGAQAELERALAVLEPCREKTLEDLVAEAAGGRRDEVYFVLPLGARGPVPGLPPGRTAVIPPDVMRSIMYYAA